MTSTKKKPAKKPKQSITGRYVYDAKTDRIVKVSDRIPSIAGRGSKGESEGCDSGPCGSGPCGSGACGM